MTIEEILTKWETEAKIDMSNISKEAANIPMLHISYYRMYVNESLRVEKIRANIARLRNLKKRYYRGELDQNELKEHNWPQFNLKILKSEIQDYLDADDDIINENLKLVYAERKVKTLEDIVKEITFRGFKLNTIVEYEKFKAGTH